MGRLACFAKDSFPPRPSHVETETTDFCVGDVHEDLSWFSADDLHLPGPARTASHERITELGRETSLPVAGPLDVRG